MRSWLAWRSCRARHRPRSRPPPCTRCARIGPGSAGDYALAFDEAMVAAADEQIAMFYYFDALRAAIWGRDLMRAREVARRMDENPDTGIAVAADRVGGARRGRRARGSADEAIAGFRAAMATYRSIGSDLWLARTALNFVSLMDVDEPTVREAAAEARADLRARPSPGVPRATRCGARPACWRRPSPVDAATTTASATRG